MTSVESERLFAAIRRLAASGRACLYITHRMRELPGLADRVTVLRRGRVVACAGAQELSAAQLVGLIVPQRPPPSESEAPTSRGRGEALVALSSVSTASSAGAALRDVSLELRRGRIVGVAGVVGNGQETLVDVFLGLTRPSLGSVTFSDGARPIAYIPSEARLGAVGPLSVAENLVLGREREPRFSTGPLLRRGRCRAYADDVIRRYDIKAPGPWASGDSLSAGNLRRVVLARELDKHASVIIAADPAAGLDIAGAADVRGRLAAAARAGAGVLLVSSDLDEIFEVADAIVVMREGAVVMRAPREETDPSSVALAMMGRQEDQRG